MIRYLVGLFLALALGIMGCSETSGPGGSGGDGGVGGAGGSAGTGGGPVPCQPVTDRCSNGPVEPHEACCEQTVPDQANACDGTESTDNPASCTPTENPITYRLTLMEVEGDCNVGYDLDGCDGHSCLTGKLTPAEGASGVDNALAGFARIAAGGGGNLGTLNRLFSDALCGMTEGETCDGGENDGDLCVRDEDCVGAEARCVRANCRLAVSPTEIRFVIDANATEGCAHVTVLAGGEANAHILNLSEDGCASGSLGTIPLSTDAVYTAREGVYQGIDGSLTQTKVRMTVSSAGFSHGLLGAVMDAATAWEVFWAVLGGAVDPTSSFLDANASPPPTQPHLTECNGLSATLRIGGVAE